jgi:asparagine synthase (glutamine-hydrolysing)
MMAVYDEPFSDSSNIPTYLIAQYARRHVKVVLSGDGADEIFGGYESYLPFSAACGFADSTTPLPSSSDPWTAHTGQSLSDRSSLWSPQSQPPSSPAIRERYVPAPEIRGIDRAVLFDLECYLPGDILVKVDRAAMAHGLETRAPFLDVDLAEFVLGLSSQLRFANGRLKHLLREAFSQFWPMSVRNRGKQGFGAPVRAWLAKPDLKELWEHSIRRDGPLCALLPGLPDVAAELRPQRKWTLLCLARWLETRTLCLANLSSAY